MLVNNFVIQGFLLNGNFKVHDNFSNVCVVWREQPEWTAEHAQETSRIHGRGSNPGGIKSPFFPFSNCPATAGIELGDLKSHKPCNCWGEPSGSISVIF